MNKPVNKSVKKPGNPKVAPPESQRIAKFLAHAGVCSRRAAEKLILDKKVSVNGKIIESPALNVSTNDLIEIEGKKISSREKTRLWAYNKPVGFLCTQHDPEGRPTVFDNLKDKRLPYTVSVGRLDFNSEGLLLLTNNGDLARFLELPTTQCERHYRVRVKGLIKEVELSRLQKGITVEGIDYQPIEAMIEHYQSSNTWITMILREGKNREIRRILEHLGYAVNRLIRLNYGAFKLGDLKAGEVKEVPQSYLQQVLPKKFL